MADKVLGRMIVEVGAKTAGLVDDLHKADGAIAKTGGGLGTLLKQGLAMGAGMAVVSKGIELLSKGPELIGSSIDAASDLNESLGKVNVVFEANAKGVIDWANGSAKALGQSKQQALEAAGTYGNLFRAFGIGLPQAQDMSTSLVQLAADLASFNNTSVDDALIALRSGLSGETEPLKRYGVAINDVRLHEEALKLGLIATITEALTPGAKAQASYALIMHDTALAQGDFARTSDGLANKSRIQAAQWEDMKAKLGGLLLPMKLVFVGMLADHVIPALSKAIDIGGTFGEMIKAVFTGDVMAAGEAFNSLPGPLQSVALFLGQVKVKVEEFLPTLKDVGSFLRDMFLGDLKAIGENLLGVLKNLGEMGAKLVQFSQESGGARMALMLLGGALVIIAKAVTTTLVGFTSLLDFVTSHDEVLGALAATIITLLVPAMIAWVAATYAQVMMTISLAIATALAYAPYIAIALAIGLVVLAIIYLIKHWDEIKEKTLEVAFAIKDYVVGAFGGILDWLKDNWPQVVEILMGPFGLIVMFATDGFGIRTAFKNAITDLLSWLKEHWREVATIFAGPFAAVVALALDAFGVRTALKNAITDLIKWVTEHWREVATIFSGPFAPIVALALDAFGIRTALKNAITDIISWVTEHWKYIALIFLWPFIPLVAMATDAFGIRTALKNAITETLDWLRARLAELPGQVAWLMGLVVNAFLAAMQAIFNTVVYVGTAVINWFKDLPKKIKDAIGDGLQILYQLGIDILQGLLNGLIFKWTDIASWIGDRAKEVPGIFKKIFKADSPSRVMHDIGVDVMTGFKNGLESGWGGMMTRLDQMASDVLARLHKMADDAAAAAWAASQSMSQIATTPYYIAAPGQPSQPPPPQNPDPLGLGQLNKKVSGYTRDEWLWILRNAGSPEDEIQARLKDMFGYIKGATSLGGDGWAFVHKKETILDPATADMFREMLTDYKSGRGKGSSDDDATLAQLLEAVRGVRGGDTHQHFLELNAEVGSFERMKQEVLQEVADWLDSEQIRIQHTGQLSPYTMTSPIRMGRG